MVSSTCRPPSPKDQRWTPSLWCPSPLNEPVHDYAPGSPERARLTAELDKLASNPLDIQSGDRRRAPHGRRPGLRRRPAAPPRERDRHATPRPRRPMSPTRSRRRSRPPPAGASCPSTQRAAVFLRAADLLAGPWRETLAAATMLGQSKTAYQAEIDTPCELIDFWRFNVALRPADPGRPADLLARRVEPGRVPPAGGLRLRDHPVQLHRDRRQPADRAGPDGQHRGLEAVPDPGRRRVPDHAAARGRRAAGRRDQPGPRRRPARLRRRAERPPAGRHPLHRLDRDLPAPVAAGRQRTSPTTAATRGWSARPAARTSSSRTAPPTPRC